MKNSREVYAAANVALGRSDTDMGRLGLLGAGLLIFEFVGGSGVLIHRVARYSEKPMAWACFLFLGLLCVALATAAASLFTLWLDSTFADYPIRVYVESVLVSGVFFLCFFSLYRIVVVELLFAHWRSFFTHHWAVLVDVLMERLSFHDLDTIGLYTEESLRGYLLSRLPLLFTVLGYVFMILGEGDLLPKMHIIVMAIPEKFLEEMMEMEDEDEDGDDEDGGGDPFLLEDEEDPEELPDWPRIFRRGKKKGA